MNAANDPTNLLLWINRCQLSMTGSPDQRVDWEGPVSEKQAQDQSQAEQGKYDLRNPLHRLGQMRKNQSEYPVEHCDNQQKNKQGDHQVDHSDTPPHRKG